MKLAIKAGIGFFGGLALGLSSLSTAGVVTGIVVLVVILVAV